MSTKTYIQIHIYPCIYIYHFYVDMYGGPYKEYYTADDESIIDVLFIGLAECWVGVPRVNPSLCGALLTSSWLVNRTRRLLFPAAESGKQSPQHWVQASHSPWGLLIPLLPVCRWSVAVSLQTQNTQQKVNFLLVYNGAPECPPSSPYHTHSYFIYQLHSRICFYFHYLLFFFFPFPLTFLFSCTFS